MGNDKLLAGKSLNFMMLRFMLSAWCAYGTICTREVNMTIFAEEFSFSEARDHLADIANKVIYAGKRAILTRKGKRAVAIVSIEDLEALQAIEDQIDLEDAKKALVNVKKHGTISLETIKRKHNL